MIVPYGDFEFPTTIIAIPEKAKDTETTFAIVFGLTRRGARSNKKAGTKAPAFD
jgi:hypothetical protein